MVTWKNACHSSFENKFYITVYGRLNPFPLLLYIIKYIVYKFYEKYYSMPHLLGEPFLFPPIVSSIVQLGLPFGFSEKTKRKTEQWFIIYLFLNVDKMHIIKVINPNSTGNQTGFCIVHSFLLTHLVVSTWPWYAVFKVFLIHISQSYSPTISLLYLTSMTDTRFMWFIPVFVNVYSPIIMAAMIRWNFQRAPWGFLYLYSRI